MFVRLIAVGGQAEQVAADQLRQAAETGRGLLVPARHNSW